jgi:hypothetical protein
MIMQKLHDLLKNLTHQELADILNDARISYHVCATQEKLISLIIEKLSR